MHISFDPAIVSLGIYPIDIFPCMQIEYMDIRCNIACKIEILFLNFFVK